MIVFDERDLVPVRTRIGELMAAATTADFAVGRIRLAALDFGTQEVAAVQRCRVLLGRFDAGTLMDAGRLDAASMTGAAAQPAVERVSVLLRFALSGRLEVRGAGLADWAPDFSVYGRVAPGPAAALVGAHVFGAPYPVVGPLVTVLVRDPVAVALLRERYEEIWDAGHDVLPAIVDVLERAHGMAVDATGGGGEADRAGARR